MTVREAIIKADKLRANQVAEQLKCEWIYGLEGEVADLMGVTVPQNNYPDTSHNLLMSYPYDDFYYLYLIAMIDFAIEETALYQNDMLMYESARDKAFSWWRRNNRKTQNEIGWGVM